MEGNEDTKICENCGEPHTGVYGSGRFCSSKCARGFSTKAKRREINAKVSKSLAKDPIFRECTNCGKKFKLRTNKKSQKCCSMHCAGKIRGTSHLLNWDRSEVMKRAYRENGIVSKGGRTKWFDYKDIRVQGTYELRTCQILDNWKQESKIYDWEYTNDRFPYIDGEENSHTYLLDFKVFMSETDFYYIETKGFERTLDSFKWEAVRSAGHRLDVWFLKDIEFHENRVVV